MSSDLHEGLRKEIDFLERSSILKEAGFVHI